MLVFIICTMGTYREESTIMQCKNSCGDVKRVNTWVEMVNLPLELTILQRKGYHETECAASSEETYACWGAINISSLPLKRSKMALINAIPPKCSIIAMFVTTEAVSYKAEDCTLWNDGGC